MRAETRILQVVVKLVIRVIPVVCVESLTFSWSTVEANGKKTFPFFYAFSSYAVKNILMFSLGYLHMLRAIVFIKS